MVGNSAGLVDQYYFISLKLKLKPLLVTLITFRFRVYAPLVKLKCGLTKLMEITMTKTKTLLQPDKLTITKTKTKAQGLARYTTIKVQIPN